MKAMSPEEIFIDIPQIPVEEQEKYAGMDVAIMDGKVIATISEPNIPVMEAIGGTGDTITGLVSSFLAAGFDLDKAAIAAAKANRMAGKYANPTTATKIWEIISQFPHVFEKHLCEWSGVCEVY